MAKKSAVLRDEKRRKMYEKYKAKRAELKAAGDLEGLQKLPRNASVTRLKNRDMLDELEDEPVITVPDIPQESDLMNSDNQMDIEKVMREGI